MTQIPIRCRVETWFVSRWLIAGLTLSWSVSAETRDPAAAEQLYREARALMEQGRVAEACPKFLESQRLDASSGTLLNLAECHEKQGKVATAWAEYLETARLAKAQKRDDRAQAAAEFAAALEAQVPYLVIEITEPVPGLSVERGGTALSPAAFGSRVPTDPGSYEIVASAAGYEPFRQTVTLVNDGSVQTVVVPPLVPRAQRPGPLGRVERSPAGQDARWTRSETDAPSGFHWNQRVTASVVLGASGAALVTGSVFGVLAINKNKELVQRCGAELACSNDDAIATSLSNARFRYAIFSTVGFGAFAVGTAAGLYLWLSDRPKETKTGAPAERRFMILPEITDKHGALTVHGRF